MKLIGFLLIVLGLTSLGSVFAWAAFDVSWWAPLESSSNHDHMLRGLVIFLMHVILMAFAAVSIFVMVENNG